MAKKSSEKVDRQEARRAYMREYLRQYRANNPARITEHRIQTAINFLARAGYRVEKIDHDKDF